MYIIINLYQSIRKKRHESAASVQQTKKRSIRLYLITRKKKAVCQCVWYKYKYHQVVCQPARYVVSITMDTASIILKMGYLKKSFGSRWNDPSHGTKCLMIMRGRISRMDISATYYAWCVLLWPAWPAKFSMIFLQNLFFLVASMEIVLKTPSDLDPIHIIKMENE